MCAHHGSGHTDQPKPPLLVSTPSHSCRTSIVKPPAPSAGACPQPQSCDSTLVCPWALLHPSRVAARPHPVLPATEQPLGVLEHGQFIPVQLRTVNWFFSQNTQDKRTSRQNSERDQPLLHVPMPKNKVIFIDAKKVSSEMLYEVLLFCLNTL